MKPSKTDTADTIEVYVWFKKPKQMLWLWSKSTDVHANLSDHHQLPRLFVCNCNQTAPWRQKKKIICYISAPVYVKWPHTLFFAFKPRSPCTQETGELLITTGLVSQNSCLPWAASTVRSAHIMSTLNPRNEPLCIDFVWSVSRHSTTQCFVQLLHTSCNHWFICRVQVFTFKW